jgi:hypothetical protein
MKFFSAFILALVLASCKSTSLNRTIKFNVTSTSDYCGGAMPNEEIMESLMMPTSFNGTLYIHKNPERIDKGIALKFKNGKASITGLVNGDYAIFKHPAFISKDKLENNESDENLENECEMMRNFQMLEMVNINQETREITIHIHFMCDPCQEPMP